jgi:hypothetical protein
MDDNGLGATREKVQEKQGRSKGRFCAVKDAEHRGQLGRPSTYRKRYATAAALLAKNGATDPQIAEFFGISQATLNGWKARSQEFSRAITHCNEALTPFIERSLAHRALGMTLDQEKIYYDSDAGEIVRVQTKEQLPPDTRAAERWLQAKGGPEWQPAAQRIDHRVLVRNMSDAELAAALASAQELLALSAPAPSESPDDGE